MTPDAPPARLPLCADVSRHLGEDPIGTAPHVAQDAHFAQGDDGAFRVGELVECLPQRGELLLPLPLGEGQG